MRCLTLSLLACCLVAPLCLPAAEEEGFRPLWNGKDLEGWEGRTDLWSVVDGAILGNSPGLKENHFLVTKEEFKNFELRFEVKLHEPTANSGVQFWSQRVTDSTEMIGFQADIGPGYWGCIYDESRRRKMMATPKPETVKEIVKDREWNHYTVRAEGSKITLSINGTETVSYVEEDAEIPRNGRFGLQVHSGNPFKIEFRNLRVKTLP